MRLPAVSCAFAQQAFARAFTAWSTRDIAAAAHSPIPHPLSLTTTTTDYQNYLAAAQRQISQSTANAYAGLANMYVTSPTGNTTSAFAPSTFSTATGYPNYLSTSQYGLPQSYALPTGSSASTQQPQVQQTGSLYSQQPPSTSTPEPLPQYKMDPSKSPAMTGGVDSKDGSRTPTPNQGNSTQGNNSNNGNGAPSNPNTTAANAAAMSAAVAASSAPHVRFFLDPSAQLSSPSNPNSPNSVFGMTQAQAQQTLALAQQNVSAGQYGTLPQLNLLARTQSGAAPNPTNPQGGAASAAGGNAPNNANTGSSSNNNNNGANANNGDNGANGQNGRHGLDYLAMACDTFQLQDQSGMKYPQGDDMWRPW